MFDTILVANRGEIARRIFRTAQMKGYKTVAVYSDADAQAPHVEEADMAVAIGGNTPAESYLVIDKIIDAAKKTGAGAVHPGYGFLAENAEFAEACAAAGLVFIGPPVDAIRLMGSKRLSKERMIDSGVPCVPGYTGADQATDTLITEAQNVGVPLMVKASAGGGGRGLRLVTDIEDVAQAIETAASEALNAFGDGELIIEKAVLEPRHVEIQVFADNHGNVLHLGERDCSVQRRHQKVVEEAPGPSVTPEIRAAMGKAAVDAARAVDYRGAGTVEFLLGNDGNFYFMEMNTRLQVEHPVTEEITGEDLVSWQIDVAAGKTLPISQDEVEMTGHAIEVRLYAEDPYSDFLPQTGVITAWGGDDLDIRVDSGIEAGSEISAYYDPMIAKLIAWGEDRDEARRKLSRALDQLVLHGFNHNAAFLRDILNNDVFAKGQATTAFIGEQFPELEAPVADSSVNAVAAYLLSNMDGGARESTNTPLPVRLKLAEDGQKGTIVMLDGDSVTVGDAVHEITLLDAEDEGRVVLAVDSVRQTIALSLDDDDRLWLGMGGKTWCFTEQSMSEKAGGDAAAADAITAPMSGAIVAVKTETGADVKKGDVLIVLEAMKMQHELTAPRDGVVAELRASEGAQVNSRDLLLKLEEESEEAA